LPNTVQYANNSVYYLKYKDKAIYQIAANGAAKKLTFIPAKDSLHFLISIDGKKIAWSFINQTTGNPASELWLANIDGSGAKKIAQIDAASNSKWLTFEPYRWLPDGRLLYVEEPTGIGGYILFSGFAGIRVFDPATNVSNTLTPGVGSGNLCLSEISPDLKVVVSACATNNHSVLSFVTIANKNVVSIAEQADQKQAGSAFYSPGGSWLAYAFAIANPDAEQGKVAVVQANGTTPKILDTVKNGYFNVVGWVSEQQFVVQRYEGDKPSLWLFNRDGSAPIKLADGSFAAFIPK
jgi:tricorn protease-like protein